MPQEDQHIWKNFHQLLLFLKNMEAKYFSGKITKKTKTTFFNVFLLQYILKKLCDSQPLYCKYFR